MQRTKLLGSLLVLCGNLACSASGHTQDFPAKPVRIIVAYPAGGSPDVVARFLAPQMSATLGQPILVENRPGAGGLPAVQELLRSGTDGYSMLIADVSQFAILPSVRPGVYDPLKDLQPVGQVTTNAVFIIASSSLPAKNMQEFVALVKSKPGQYNYGSPGIGTVHHLFMEATKAAYGLDLNHVPFKGAAQSLVSLLNGDVLIAIAGLSTTQQQISEGKLRAIGASTRERDRLAPNVQSAAELGNPDLDYAGDQGYFVAGGTSKNIVDKLAAAVGKAAMSTEFASRASALGTNVKYRSPEQFAEMIREAYPRYQRVVKLADVKPQ